MNCKLCRFFMLLEGDVGECRRRAPVPRALPREPVGPLIAEWPIVCYDDWCGEFELDAAKELAEDAAKADRAARERRA
jgi:hypothetical protein